MRARRLPRLTHPKTTPDEPVDAATRGLWLKLTYYQNGQEQYLE